MGTFDITLPNTQKAVFPPLCVVCEKKNPDSVIKLSFLGVNTTPSVMMAVDEAVYGDVDPRYSGGNTSNRIEGIPACKGCSSGLKWYHRLLKFGYYTGWLPGVGLIFLGVPTWISVAVCVIGACSPGVYTLMFPPSFGASFLDTQANFEFKSYLVATEFLRLNSEATLKNKDKTEPAAAPEKSENVGN
jgi:hypothetical protein